MLNAGEEQQTPIQDWLDIMRVPWRATRRELSSCWGIVRQPGGFPQAVEIDLPRPPLAGLLRPFCFQLSPGFSPDVPPVEFFARTYFEADERNNVAQTAGELISALGSTEVGVHHNTIRARWTFGRSRIDLLAWPRELQHAASRRSDTDPRLASSCYVSVTTGFRLALNATEIDDLEAVITIGTLPLSTELRDRFAPNENELEFVRDPVGWDNVTGFLGVSRNRRSLLFQRSELFLVEIAAIVAVRLERWQPGRGPGCSSLMLECRSKTGSDSKSLLVCSASGPDELNDLASALSNAVAKPLDVRPYLTAD